MANLIENLELQVWMQRRAEGFRFRMAGQIPQALQAESDCDAFYSRLAEDLKDQADGWENDHAYGVRFACEYVGCALCYGSTGSTGSRA